MGHYSTQELLDMEEKKRIDEGRGRATQMEACTATDCIRYDKNTMNNCILPKITIKAKGKCVQYKTR